MIFKYHSIYDSYHIQNIFRSTSTDVIAKFFAKRITKALHKEFKPIFPCDSLNSQVRRFVVPSAPALYTKLSILVNNHRKLAAKALKVGWRSLSAVYSAESGSKVRPGDDKPIWPRGEACSVGNGDGAQGGRDERNAENRGEPRPRDDTLGLYLEKYVRARGEVEPRPMSFPRARLLWNCVAEARPRGFPPRTSLDTVSSSPRRFSSPVHASFLRFLCIVLPDLSILPGPASSLFVSFRFVFPSDFTGDSEVCVDDGVEPRDFLSPFMVLQGDKITFRRDIVEQRVDSPRGKCHWTIRRDNESQILVSVSENFPSSLPFISRVLADQDEFRLCTVRNRRCRREALFSWN